MKRNRTNRPITYKHEGEVSKMTAVTTDSEKCPNISDDLEGYIYYKVKNNQSLTESELRSAVFELCEVKKTIGDNRRWSRSVKSYLECKDKIICIPWEEGLTECQENEFFNQPYFVKKHTYEKTITVVEYVRESAERPSKAVAPLPCPKSSPCSSSDEIELD